MPLLSRAPQPAPPVLQVGCALLLAAAAGFVDAYGYLVLARVFTSHMTGNTSSLGLYSALRDPRQVLWHGWPIVGFVAGLLAGACLTEWGRRRSWQSRLSLVLAVEIVLLGLLWNFSSAAPAGALRFALVALPALAMGMQTVTVTRVRKLRFYTTYMTGNLAKFAEAMVSYAFWFGDRRRAARHAGVAAPEAEDRAEALHHLLVTAALWIVFVAGAYFGALGELGSRRAALAWPVAALILVLLADVARPLAPVAAGESPGLRL